MGVVASAAVVSECLVRYARCTFSKPFAAAKIEKRLITVTGSSAPTVHCEVKPAIHIDAARWVAMAWGMWRCHELRRSSCRARQPTVGVFAALMWRNRAYPAIPYRERIPPVRREFLSVWSR